MPSNKVIKIVSIPEDWESQLDPILPSRRQGGFSFLVRKLLRDYALKHGIVLLSDMRPIGGQRGSKRHD